MSDSQAAAEVGKSSPAGPAGGGPGRGRGLLGLVTAVMGSKLVRWGFVAVTVGIGAYAVVSEWSHVSSALTRLGFLPVLGALVAVLAALVAAMQVWRVLLAALGSPLPARPAARIMFIGQLGKYLPGSIWPVLAQMELGNEYQVPRHRSASASVLTMLLVVIAGLLTALVALPFVAGSTNDVWALLAAPALLVLLIPRVLNAVLSRLLRLARRPPLEVELTGRAILAALAWSFVSFVGYGVQIWVLALALGAPAGKGFLLALGGFAFAWTVGFLFVIAPAGAGVRDVLLALTLGLVIGHGAALAIALVSRVLLTIGDLVTAGLAAAFTRRPGAQESDPAAS
ncbi:MAG TPA: lysylphosphatidylglycerol synthase domain-containing protein [Streptosporangiaceae bacterium]|nr:lysylphosphatidylglycerol synthase domain-containing protein [Streptosporangiaceae bacterium]